MRQVARVGVLVDPGRSDDARRASSAASGLAPVGGVTAIAAGGLRSIGAEEAGVLVWGYAASASTRRSSARCPSADYADSVCDGAQAAAKTRMTAIAAGRLHVLALNEDRSASWSGAAPSRCSSAPSCDEPVAARSGVSAIAAGSDSLALKNGRVLAWGCGDDPDGDQGQCAVPPAARSGVTAIAAGDHSLALKNGRVLAWGCDGACRLPAALRTE